MKRWAGSVGLAFLLAVFGLGVCPRPAAAAGGKPTVLIALLDETSSFVANGTKWKLSLFALQLAVKQLQPGDSFCLIGIDDHGGDPDDVRIPRTTLPAQMLRRAMVQKTLLLTLRDMKPRPTSSGYTLPNGKMKGKPFGNDVLGAVSEAQVLTNYTPSNARTRLLICSDFRDEPPTKTSGAAKKVLFPADTRLMAIFVEQGTGNPSTGLQEWQDRITSWQTRFKAMNVICTPRDFLPPAESDPKSLTPTLQQFLAQ